MLIKDFVIQEELIQKIREQVLTLRDKVYQQNEGEVRKRWHYEDSVSYGFLAMLLALCRSPFHSTGTTSTWFYLVSAWSMYFSTYQQQLNRVHGQ